VRPPLSAASLGNERTGVEALRARTELTDAVTASLAVRLGFGTIAPRLLAVVLAGVRSADAGSGAGVLTTIQ
jgi:hypothetical protein